METDNYGCDVCFNRLDYEGVNWITSTFGVCGVCYDKLTEHEKEELVIKYE